MLERWSKLCLVASWVLACALVAVGAVTTRWPFILVLVLVTAFAVGSVVLAALALRAAPRRKWSRLLTVGVLNLVLLPNVAFGVGLVVNFAIHGFDLPT
jgi:ABC-type spermidine/putrescine transport system permease subunit II